MNKLKEAKQAMINTPPERLAKIEYQSHFMHMLGVSVVCIILISRGFWWIMFAFIFSLGVSYSQWVTAHQKYNAIIGIVGEPIYDYKKDKSFTRSRDHLIKETLGKYFWLLVVGPLAYLLYDTASNYAWYWSIPLTLAFLAAYVFLYFVVLFKIAEKVYLRGMKK